MRFVAYGRNKKTHAIGLPDETHPILGLLEVALAFESRHGRVPDAVRVGEKGPIDVVSRCFACGHIGGHPLWVAIPPLTKEAKR